METGKNVSLQVSDGSKKALVINGCPATEPRGFGVLGEDFQMFSLGCSMWEPILPSQTRRLFQRLNETHTVPAPLQPKCLRQTGFRMGTHPCLGEWDRMILPAWAESGSVPGEVQSRGDQLTVIQHSVTEFLHLLCCVEDQKALGQLQQRYGI